MQHIYTFLTIIISEIHYKNEVIIFISNHIILCMCISRSNHPQKTEELIFWPTQDKINAFNIRK